MRTISADMCASTHTRPLAGLKTNDKYGHFVPLYLVKTKTRWHLLNCARTDSVRRPKRVDEKLWSVMGLNRSLGSTEFEAKNQLEFDVFEPKITCSTRCQNGFVRANTMICVCVCAWRANSFRVVDDNKRQRGIYWDIYEMKFPMEFYHFHSEERWRFGRSMKIIDREKDKTLFRYERNEQRLRQFFDYRQQNFLLSLCSALFAYSNCWRQLFQTIFVRKNLNWETHFRTKWNGNEFNQGILI